MKIRLELWLIDLCIQDDHEVADNTYRDGESRLNNTEASFIQDGGVSVDQRKMNAGKVPKTTA